MKINETNIVSPTTLTSSYMGEKPNNCEWVDEHGKSCGKICDLNCPNNAMCNWATAWGGALTKQDGEIIHGSFSINDKVTLYIIGDALRIVDLKHKGKIDVWEWVSDKKYWMKSFFSKYHELDKEDCLKYLNADGSSIFWKMFQKRAIEIFNTYCVI